MTEALIWELPDAGIELEDEENSTGLMYLPQQSPRGLSSRASQVFHFIIMRIYTFVLFLLKP
jgi:hypothetical protein